MRILTRCYARFAPCLHDGLWPEVDIAVRCCYAAHRQNDQRAQCGHRHRPRRPRLHGLYTFSRSNHWTSNISWAGCLEHNPVKMNRAHRSG